MLPVLQSHCRLGQLILLKSKHNSTIYRHSNCRSPNGLQQTNARKPAARATFMRTRPEFSDILLLTTIAITTLHITDMYDIPETGFLRLSQVLGVIPLGKTCWWEGVRSGRFPKPVKLTARCTAWRAEDIRELIAVLSNQPPTSKC